MAAHPGAAGKDVGDNYHVIDIDDGAAPPECAVCMELLEWAAVGSCGHNAVCGTCAVRLRYVHDDYRCCICRTHCRTVIVTKAGCGDGSKMRALAELVRGPFMSPAAAGTRYWYHGGSRAYFDDEQYEAAKKACRDADVNHGRPPDCCLPAVALLLFYIFLAICSLLSFAISITS